MADTYLSSEFSWPDKNLARHWFTETEYAFDSENEGGAFVVKMCHPDLDSTFTISKVVFWIDSVQSAGEVRVRLTTADSKGKPSNTLVGTDSDVVVTLGTGDTGRQEFTLTTGPTINKDDIIAVSIISYNNGTSGANPASFTLKHHFNHNRVDTGLPVWGFKDQDSTGWGDPIFGQHCFGLEDSSGDMLAIHDTYLIGDYDDKTATPTREPGVKFISKVSGKLEGIMFGGFYNETGTGDDFYFDLYDSAGTTLLASATEDTVRTIAYYGYSNLVVFETPPIVTQGTEYRVVLRNGSGGDIAVWPILEKDLKATRFHPDYINYTERDPSDSSWDDTDGGDLLVNIAIVYSHIKQESAGGSGMIRHPGMAANLNG